MRARLIASLLAATVLGSVIPDALALSCVHPSSERRMTPEQYMNHRMAEFQVVFAATPIESHRDGDYQVTRFQVLRVFKGSVQRETLAYEQSIFDAPTSYAPDKAYVVFAWVQPDGRLNSSNECAGVIELALHGGHPRYPAGLGRGWNPH